MRQNRKTGKRTTGETEINMKTGRRTTGEKTEINKKMGKRTSCETGISKLLQYFKLTSGILPLPLQCARVSQSNQC